MDPIVDNEHSNLLGTKRKSWMERNSIKYAAITFVILVTGSLFLWSTPSNPNKGQEEFKGRLVTGYQGAVAVEAEECSDVGIQVLKDGGNAVDSSIASALCIGVIDSFATGIGGGGFMLIRSPNGTYEFIDFRETAPAASHKDMFIDQPDLAKYGGMAVGVPGEIRGFELAHSRHGKLPWKALFEPAIKLARGGFKTTRLLEKRLQSGKPWMENSTEWTDVFAPQGHLAKAGELIKRTQLANTLEIIANEGADAFYVGTLAQHMVNTTQAAGGILTLEDMASYRPLIRPAIHTYYHGRKVVTCSAPTSGPVILSVLNLLERFNLKMLGNTGLNVHRLVEAFKFGYAFRTELGDPEFTQNYERLDEIVSKEWSSIVRKNISDETTFDPMYYQPKFDHVDTHGTMHLSVVDKNDGAVALTSTVNLLFGARLLDPVTGVIMNDEMDDFSIPGKPNTFGLYPSAYNYAAPGKRPLSSITPVIIERDSEFEIAIGGSGGSGIPTATLDVILNVIDYDMDLYEAIASPRVHHQLIPNVAIVEHDYDQKMGGYLEEKGHDVVFLDKSLSATAVQAVGRLTNGRVIAASDPRKYGIAAAY
ncbi:gamma-glutamyltransferase [Phycomyces blakesleeanus]|uniref:Glutathione hydrolase n=2 Tax=Phycomyces blakesleeanus TaxID=4837 RepID=A0A167K1S6_PHYB8|nr:hypothetical protein PHYBLDRAFT_137033 [Phycomyces blakesleeanus NRRL 1555(-)]OAD67079.1 hypothetical protein PHYBLDRAFT_137033 [Phycomyces blakesleeanus NRRL 1555(-)]|eukprot:XP_018285119.1 hypothetical protein PHYBLDRAFT_137033 [Phycomyces blakesleeanus NRRL 1555(-)]